MNMEEFLDNGKVDAAGAGAETDEPMELDVQKAVVEELAVDKARLEETCESLKRRAGELEAKVAALESDKAAMVSENTALKASVAKLSAEKEELESRESDMQERNPNSLALLDRDVELPDRFPGETRDHVIEVLKEARDAAEAAGRQRRAQVLEGVLVANEPNGSLAKKRAELKKVFAENLNVVSGPVIEYLKDEGISYKRGEEFLSMDEIFKATY